MIFELKHVNYESELVTALQEATSQIIKKKYESRLIYEGYTSILKYGISFYGKRCIIGEVK